MTRTYGIARPLKYDEVKPGMLIAAQHSGRKVIGLAFAGDRETLIAVFDDNGEQDPSPPYVLDLADLHTTAVLIPGERQITPAQGDASFTLLPQRRAPLEGLVICSDGRVAIAVNHRDFGQSKFLMLDFDTGEPIGQVSQVAALPDWELYIVEEGHATRRRVSASA